MIIKSKMRALLAGVLFCAAGAVTAQASSSIVTFSVDMSTNIANGTFIPGTDQVSVGGSFNGWAGPGLVLVQVGSSTIYTNTANDTSDPNGTNIWYKFYNNDASHSGFESLNYSYNRVAFLPVTSGASLVLPTPFFGDLGALVVNNVSFQVDMSQQIVLGTFTNGINTVSVNGGFNGWSSTDVLTNNPNIVVTNAGNVLTSNVWVGTFAVSNSPWGNFEYKYVIQPAGNYEGPSAKDSDGQQGENRFFAFNPTTPTSLPSVFFSDAPFAPVSKVTFSVDMSAQLYYGNWTPSAGVYCQGINGDWNNDAVNTMTNNPLAANTNIYYVTYTLGEGSGNSYKFNDGVYEDFANNRSYTVPYSTPVNVPTVYFNNLSINDLLTTNVAVTFTVNMTNASQYPSGPAFNPSSDTVYVNGAWLGWATWAPPPIGGVLQLTNINPPGLLYSGTFVIPKGGSIGTIYKYSINGTDDEAGSGNNHERYIRTTATGAYSFPTDTFGNQYNEPSFGQLAVGSVSAGTVPLSWLGAPNVTVQTTPNLTGTWVTQTNTSGTVWSVGNNSANGLVSVTNWPAGSGSLFFRLIQQ